MFGLFKKLAVAATVLLLAAAPALAQEPTRIKTETDINQPIAIEVCGSTNASLVGFERSILIQRPEDGGSEFHAEDLGDIVDSTSGQKLGVFRVTLNFTFAPGSLPAVLQLNIIVTCIGSGVEINLRSGLTVDENGQTHLHSLL